MRLKFTPSIPHGTITAPPSKSYAHRRIIALALGKGDFTLHGVTLSEDVLATLDAIKMLDRGYSYSDGTLKIFTQKSDDVLSVNCNQSGSTLRFFIPLALASGKKVTLNGSEKLFSRGIDVYEKCLTEATFEKTKTSVTLCGKISAGAFEVEGGVSSQYITGLLFALPLLGGDSVIDILPPVESEPYIDITLDVLKDYGVDVKKEGNKIYIKGNQTYVGKDGTVEGDYSNGAFLDAFNAIEGGRVTVTGYNEDSTQGDKAYKEFFPTLQKEFSVIDIKNAIDLGPVLFAYSALFHGGKFLNTKRLVIKESNRAEAMKTELEKFGVKVSVEENSVTVCGGELKTPTVPIQGHNDHRIVMANCLLLSKVGGEIDGAEAVNKSFPDYFESIRTLGIIFNEI